MNRLGAGLGALAVAFTILGLGGKLPHQWLGISTETLIGWGIVLAVPALIVVMLLVIMDRQRQLNRKLNYLIGRSAGVRRTRVVKGPWEGSG